jgi:hypothetical protein
VDLLSRLPLGFGLMMLVDGDPLAATIVGVPMGAISTYSHKPMPQRPELCWRPPQTAEVNLLTARIVKRPFGVTDALMALGPDTTQSMHSMLDELDGELLFGRPVDVDLWNADLERGRVVDLEHSIAEPSELFETAGVDERQAALTSLPLVIQTPDGYEPYASDRDLAGDDRVEALGRIEGNASIEQPTVAAPD